MVKRVSEALGVWRTCMVKIEVAALDCGAPATPTIKVIAIRNIFVFIVP
jgi:hypothetical protein